MEEQTFIAALAGLLRAVETFAQRANTTPASVTEQIIPAQWLTKFFGSTGQPDERWDKIVSLAENFSASGEPISTTPSQPLQSIFCSLTGLEEKAPAAKYLPLKKLAIAKDTIFPTAEIDDSQTAYKELWDDFLAEAQSLKTAHEPDGNLTVYLDNLLNLMQQYTWCIPSAYYRSVPDVSLYDHSRMTAALAACLVGLDALPAPDSSEPAALLVGGDISGVQKFIYTITSSGAAGGLRGRSLYLQLLTEVVARYMLNEMRLPRTNVIYAGGGHF